MDLGILYVVFNKWISNPETNEIPYKIGITRGSVEDRYYGLGLKMPGKFETLFAYEFDDCAKAEQLIHGILNKKRENGEWFTITEMELEHIKKTCEIMGGKLVTNEVENEIETEIGSETIYENELDFSEEHKNDKLTEEYRPTKKLMSTKITGKDILNMDIGETISDFLNIIVNSKVPYSENWAGEEYKIKNTPMKGINWIGNDYKPLAVIIRTTGKYKEDSNGEQYAFEAKNGVVDKNIKSNQVLIHQQKYNYPILYFLKKGKIYTLIGKYTVDKIHDKYVTLIPYREKK
jgi:hypothetical protein